MICCRMLQQSLLLHSADYLACRLRAVLAQRQCHDELPAAQAAQACTHQQRQPGSRPMRPAPTFCAHCVVECCVRSSCSATPGGPARRGCPCMHGAAPPTAAARGAAGCCPSAGCPQGQARSLCAASCVCRLHELPCNELHDRLVPFAHQDAGGIGGLPIKCGVPPASRRRTQGAPPRMLAANAAQAARMPWRCRL
jgi:hypothetical protein